MMEGLELAGLLGLVPTVGGEEDISTNVTRGCRSASRQLLEKETPQIRAELPWCPRKVSAEPIFVISLPAECIHLGNGRKP